MKSCTFNICKVRSLKLNQAKQLFLLKGPDSSADLCDKLLLAPLLHSSNREHHNAATTESHLTRKHENIPFSQISPFSSCLEGKSFLFFPEERAFYFSPRPEGHFKKLTYSCPQHYLCIF